MNRRLKGPLFIFVFLFALAFLPAQNDYNSFGDGVFDDGSNFPVLDGEPPDYPLAGEEKAEAPPEPETPEKRPVLPFKNRMVELSIAGTGIEFSNNFIASTDMIKDPFYLLGNINDIIKKPGLIWKDPVVVNLDHFFDGFTFNFGASVRPLSINFNWKDQWGVGLDIAHIDITGNFSLSGNLVTFSEAEEEKFGVGGAIFVDVGVPVFFSYGDFKIKLRPAAYVPVVYTEPKVTYRFINVEKEKDGEIVEGTRYEVNYDMRVYSLVSMEDMDALAQNMIDNARDIPKNNMGYDFKLNVEYPWRYDVDIGVDIVNIPVPFAAARLYHYMHLNGSVWADLSELDVLDLVEKDEDGNTKDLDALRGTVYDYPDDFSPEYKINTEGKKIYRPFAMVFYAHYRPFEAHPLTLIPSLGFSINYLYSKVAAIEGGLSARFDASNLFITTLGINYNDRRWINSMDFILNLRAFEFDLGISFQSQKFVRSWQGAGLGVNIGLKFGW